MNAKMKKLMDVLLVNAKNQRDVEFNRGIIVGFEARDRIAQERESKLVEALEKVKPALNIAFEDTNDLYYKNVEAELDEALAIHQSEENK